MITQDSFLETVSTLDRSPEIPLTADVYGWLIGSWELDVYHYRTVDVAALHIKGEAHFGWVLERTCRTGRLDHAPAFGANGGHRQNQ